MNEPMPAERISAAVPVAVAIVRAIDVAPTQGKAALDAVMAGALAEGQDIEALVLALANMAHALVATLARQTGTSVDALLGGIGQVDVTVNRPFDAPSPPPGWRPATNL